MLAFLFDTEIKKIVLVLNKGRRKRKIKKIDKVRENKLGVKTFTKKENYSISMEYTKMIK